MNRGRRIAAVAITVLVTCTTGFAASAAAAQSVTCDAPAGRYEATVPTGPLEGADPAELAATSCDLGFKEDRTYPLSVILLCLVATAGTLLVLRRGTSYEPIASQA